MNKSKTESLADASARAYISEVIQQLAPGERLPGMRTMIRNSGVGRIRLEWILKELEVRNVIEVRERSGRYRQRQVSVPPILFIHFSQRPIVECANGFIGGAVQILRRHAEESGHTLAMLNARDMPLTELAAILQRDNIHQAFVFGADTAAVTELIAKNVPFTVSLLPRHCAALGSELRDSPDMTIIQLKYLFQCGYRRIGYIHNVEKDWSTSPVQLQRLLDYYRIMAESGLKIEPEWVFYCGYNWEYFNSRMYELMKSRRPVDALIVPGSSLRYLYRFCANNGLAVGKDLAVMCCDDTEPNLHPRATTVTNSPREIGEQVWQIMQKLLTQKPIREVTKLKIITGETVPHQTTIE